ncbi:MAG: chemotaxis protein CheB [Magnetococcales bacterium]|nr:chemotaxis protein CheB [Magnetococcales bacterium]
MSLHMEHACRPVNKVPPKRTADCILLPVERYACPRMPQKIVVVGASTGGTDALREFLQPMPAAMNGIAIVQHLPHDYNAMLARQLQNHCAMEVRLARNGDEMRQGLVLLSPGDRHMLLHRRGSSFYVELREGPPVRRHRPSVDVLFRSTANCAGANAIGVILTGMGDDGASCMVEMRRAGALTIAQDKKTSVVFGMPAEAIRRGGAWHTLPLPAIAPKVMAACLKMNPKMKDP